MTKNKVYILLTDTGSLLTNLIKLYTRKPYNHASISFDSELSEVYSFGRKKAGNPLDGGFVKEDVKNGLFKQADCALYSITVTDKQLLQMREYIKRLEMQQEKYRYNFLGLFGFIFQKPVKRKNAFFCSQFVASVLKEANQLNVNRPLELIAPNDLQEMSNMHLEYEGALSSYLHDDVETRINIPMLIPAEM